MPKGLIANLFTLLNLFCGCLGVVCAFQAELVWSSYLIGIGALCDFFDGLAARMFGGSKIGGQLDSLADMITFGLLPGVMLFQFITIGLGEYFTDIGERDLYHVGLASIGLLVTLFSALRLAKFNIDERQLHGFRGLPTPASAIVVAAFPLILGVQYDINFYVPATPDALAYMANTWYYNEIDVQIIARLFDPHLYMTLAVVLSLLLVVPLPMLALKFKGMGWKMNKERYVFLIVAGTMASTVHYTHLYFIAIPIIVLLYILTSVGFSILNPNTDQAPTDL